MDHTFTEYPVFNRACNFLHYKFYNPDQLLKMKYKIGYEELLDLIIRCYIKMNREEINEEFLHYAKMEKIIKPEDVAAGYLESVIMVGWMDPDGIMKDYYKTIFELAIKKLKRNKIVNEGILLKLSMKNCGLF